MLTSFLIVSVDGRFGGYGHATFPCITKIQSSWPRFNPHRNISMYNQDSILVATEDGLRLRIEPWSWMEMLLTVGPLRDVLGCLSRDLLGCLDVVPTGVGRQRCGRGGVAFKYWH
jgi:hypothetical protein